MNRFIYLLLWLTSFNSWTQEDTIDFKFPPASSVEIKEDDFWSCNYSMKPQYRGGIPALKSYISENFVYDETDTCRMDQKYKCKLIISDKGTVSSVTIASYPDFPSCEKCKTQIEKMLLNMHWIPAEIEGKKFADVISFPISIRSK